MDGQRISYRADIGVGVPVSQRGYIRVAVSQNPPAWSMNTALGKSTKFTLTRGSIRYITHEIINVRLDGNLLQHQREPLIYASVATAQTLKTPLRRLVLLWRGKQKTNILQRAELVWGKSAVVGPRPVP